MFKFIVTPTIDNRWNLECEELSTGKVHPPQLFESFEDLLEEMALYESNIDGSSDLN